MKLTIALAALTLAACPPAPAELRITGGGYSKHLISDDVTNESHDHWAVQVNSFEVGRFNNSYSEESWYGAYEWRRNWGDIQGFVKAGAVYGYRGWYSGQGDRGWLPMINPGVRYARWTVQPEVSLVGDAVVLGISIKLQTR